MYHETKLFSTSAAGLQLTVNVYQVKTESMNSLEIFEQTKFTKYDIDSFSYLWKVYSFWWFKNSQSSTKCIITFL